MISTNARNALWPGFDELTDDLLLATWFASQQAGIDGEIQRTTNHLVLERLMVLAMNKEADSQVRAIALDAVNRLDDWLTLPANSESSSQWRAHYGYARYQIEQLRNDPSSVEQYAPVTVPPGEPIGTTLDRY